MGKIAVFSQKNLLTAYRFLDKIEAERIYYVKEMRHGATKSMANDMNLNEELQEDEVYTYTLTDEDGKEYEFELLGTCEMDGNTYYALAPIEEDEAGEYVILRAEEETDGEVSLVSIEDDDEFEKVSEFFDDELFSEVDYDAE